jgi:predicted phosphodiesterase
VRLVGRIIFGAADLLYLNARRMPTSFLVLSDIHFGRYAASTDFAPPGAKLGPQIQNAISIRASLIEKARDSNVNAVFVPGDFTSIGAPAEFQGGLDLINEIAKACKVPRAEIFHTFGNHDANSRVSRLADATPEFAEDTGYTDLCTRIGGFFVRNEDCAINGPVPGSGLFTRAEYDLFVLNSGIFCTHDQTFPHGRLGLDQLNWARGVLQKWDAGERWKIVLLHHHIFNYAYPTPGVDVSTLEEGPELLEAIGAAGVHLVCHGHRHHPKLCTQMENTWQHPVTFFCAGSVGVTDQQRNKGEIPNLFHVISLDERAESGAAIGAIDTFRYTPKTQHRTIFDFCERYLEDVEGYPECGPVLKELVESIGELLSYRIHGPHMVDGGCNFTIDSRLLDVRVIRETVEFAIKMFFHCRLRPSQAVATTNKGRTCRALSLFESHMLGWNSAVQPKRSFQCPVREFWSRNLPKRKPAPIRSTPTTSTVGVCRL